MSCFVTNFGVAGWATETRAQHGPIIQRSMRVIPRKYVILPSEATVAANQTQHFGVVDANGKAVAVRWNISGLGCYESACGTIDEQGMYHPPNNLPQPRVVTLEGVVVSDPRYSVLTEIRLEETGAGAEGVTVAREGNEVPKGEKLIAAPTATLAEGEIASRIELSPVPTAVDAAPAMSGIEITREPISSPAATVVQAAPMVKNSGTMPERSETIALPAPVATAPDVNVEVARNTNAAPLPTVVEAAPTVKNSGAPAKRNETIALLTPAASSPSLSGVKVARNVNPAPASTVVEAAPTVKNPSALPERNGLIALPAPVATTPAVNVEVARNMNAAPLPTVIEAAPIVKNSDAPPKRSETISLPAPVATAPAVNMPAVNMEVARNTNAAPLPTVVKAAPTVKNSDAPPKRSETISLLTPAASSPSISGVKVVRNVNPAPSPTVVEAAPTISSASEPRSAKQVAVPAAVDIVPAVRDAQGARKSDVAPLPTAVPVPIEAAPMGATPSLAKAGVPQGKDSAVSAPVQAAPVQSALVKSLPVETGAGVAAASTQPASVTPQIAKEDSPRVASPEPRIASIAPTTVKEALVKEKIQLASLLPFPSPAGAPAPPRQVVTAPRTPVALSPMQPTPGNGSLPVSPLVPSNQLPPNQAGANGAAIPDGVRVSYFGGLLTIDAQNVTLAEVLKAIAEKTKATIDVPPGAGMERVVEHAGPGKPNEVMERLLNGSHFNFILVNSPQHPEELTQVLLSVQPSDPQLANAPGIVNPASSLPTSPYLSKLPEAGPPVAAAAPIPLPSEPLSRDAIAELVAKRQAAARAQNGNPQP
jgi:hypothetical protein